MARPKAGRRWPAVFIQLTFASFICAALIGARVWRTGDPALSFLLWNLILAWVPFVLAVAVYGGSRHNAPGAVILLLGGLWLLFLPNAPYIVTDFVHVGAAPGVPPWYDAIVIGAFATTGVLLGFASIYLVQAVGAQRFGERTVWTAVLAVIALSSVGIYMGRVLRLNSWDAILDPLPIAGMARQRLFDPFANEALLAMAVAFTAALTAAYLVLYWFVLPRVRLGRRRRHAGR